MDSLSFLWTFYDYTDEHSGTNHAVYKCIYLSTVELLTCNDPIPFADIYIYIYIACMYTLFASPYMYIHMYVYSLVYYVCVNVFTYSSKASLGGGQ